ncbi:DUF447 domain-containing protein [Adhaeretor mobilis]|uniref:DUF447 family protein n=1 Tax=Adhaeretor mobilis TaxID=1930276 RepID=A0A517MW96_9BACT|nr:DUF447 domain-containing protein [Adhaeretor mobilis]QDS99152.1 hypothetical protein HG15A2_24440 [Adhaeretor mobilis]
MTDLPVEPPAELPKLGDSGRILESLVTTINDDGTTNLSPMGPIVDRQFGVGDARLIHFRPYNTSTTFENLRRTRRGVLHVTDDAGLIAMAAIGKLKKLPNFRKASGFEGMILTTACRWFAFEVVGLDERKELTNVYAQIVEKGTLRDHFGFNRASHAVLELAILATRIEYLPTEEIRVAAERLAPLVEKTGDKKDVKAFQQLQGYLEQELP